MTERVRLTVRVTTRAGADAVDGVDEAGRLRVRVRAAPAEGEANNAVARVLARALAVPPSSVQLVRGSRSRVKVFELDAPATPLAEQWPGLARGTTRNRGPAR